MPGASRGFSAIVARTSTSHAPVEARAYDCAEVTVVRSGAVILFGEFGHRYLNVGDVILLAPCTLYGMEPEGWVTATTLYLDRDFLVDQVFWQYAAAFSDRFDAQRFVDTHFADPAQVLRLGSDRAGSLMPWLDELVTLSIDGPPPERFYRAQSLLFSIFDVLAPDLAVTDSTRPRGRSTVRPTVPRHRPFAPVREEVRRAAELLRGSLDERWTLDRLAQIVHLSPSQVGRVFTDAFGKTPIAYLTMLRAERMAHLLRTTDEPIATVARAVGWTDPDCSGAASASLLANTGR